jgi:aspartate racemase
MKTIGIIGGIGPESTIDYYRRLLAGHRAKRPGDPAPAIIINSIDVKKLLALAAGQFDQLAQYLLDEIGRLARAGAQCGLLAANTAHVVFDQVAPLSPVPLVSIVSATCERARSLGLERLGLFGTRFTMQGPFYPQVFERAGLTLLTPAAAEQEYIHDRYMTELIPGQFLPQTRARLLEIASRMKQQEGIQGLILGGTELPLILTDSSPVGIPFLDTTAIHVDAILEYALQ